MTLPPSSSLLLVAALFGASPPEVVAAQPAPAPTAYLPTAHSHNDYDRRLPLEDAVARGFASIEVDVVLENGELFVAHDVDGTRPEVTLERLYLEPLRALVRRNGGWVYGASVPPLQLLIDVKTDADDTYEALDRTLGSYDDILTSWTGREIRPGPVSAVVSGNRAVARIHADPSRFVGIDGRTYDRRGSLPVDVMPLVSMDWDDLDAATVERRLAEASGIVRRLHQEGRRVRFWGTPDHEAFWASLASIGVDYIGTDDPERLDLYLRAVGGALALGGPTAR